MCVIEKRWVYKDHLCLIILRDCGYTGFKSTNYRCGYVVLNEYEKSDFSFYENNINVYGGITFADSLDSILSDEQQTLFDPNLFAIGFDCLHYEDRENPKSLEFCVHECEQIVDQLEEFEYKKILEYQTSIKNKDLYYSEIIEDIGEN